MPNVAGPTSSRCGCEPALVHETHKPNPHCSSTTPGRRYAEQESPESIS